MEGTHCIVELDEGFVAFPTFAHIIIISVVIDGLDLLDSLQNQTENLNETVNGRKTKTAEV